MRGWVAVALACASIAGCGDDDASALDAGACDGEPRLGCPCDEAGDVICRSPGPDLYCASDVWIASADGPCPGLDAGARTDAGATDAGPADAGAADAGSIDGGAVSDSGSGSDAGAVSDSGSASDAGSETDAGPASPPDSGPPDSGPPDAGPPATATYCVDIDVSNTCDMSVAPTEITIPAGQTAYFCWRNRSRDYAVDVWLSYGGGYTELPPGQTWDEPVGHCLGPNAHVEYADISTACSEHRFLIHCL